jgi:hypothetical protein
LEESAKDLDQAVALGGTSELQGQAWFNLGLVREKQANAAEARVAFAISNRLRPTAAAKKKLGGASACPVLRKTTGQDMSFAKTLHELASTDTDDEAKQALCLRTEGVINVPEPAVPRLGPSRTTTCSIARSCGSSIPSAAGFCCTRRGTSAGGRRSARAIAR